MKKSITNQLKGSNPIQTKSTPKSSKLTWLRNLDIYGESLSSQLTVRRPTKAHLEVSFL